ncbi:MAG: hypothetical protein ACKODT_07285 [Fluviibacter sp.]
MPTFFTMNADVSDFTNGLLTGKDGMRIHFEMNIKQGDMLTATGGTRPALIDASRKITGFIRSDGRMYDTPSISAKPFDLTDAGNLGVRLLASTTDLNSPGGVTYKVTFEQVINGLNTVYRSFTTSVVPSTDVTVNLASYAPVPRSGNA